MLNIKNTNDSRITVTGGTRIICHNTAPVLCECGNPLRDEDAKDSGICTECGEVMWHTTQFHPQMN